MPKISAVLFGALLLSSVPVQAAPTGEEALADRLEGRVAGAPVDCINLRNIRGSTIIKDTAIVYDAGRTIYVNRPRNGATSLDKWDIMVSKPFGNRLCSIDVVELRDPASDMMTGLVFLGDFVPYRKVQSASAN